MAAYPKVLRGRSGAGKTPFGATGAVARALVQISAPMTCIKYLNNASLNNAPNFGIKRPAVMNYENEVRKCRYAPLGVGL